MLATMNCTTDKANRLHDFGRYDQGRLLDDRPRRVRGDRGAAIGVGALRPDRVPLGESQCVGSDLDLGKQFHDKIDKMAIVGDKKWGSARLMAERGAPLQRVNTADRRCHRSNRRAFVDGTERRFQREVCRTRGRERVLAVTVA